MKLDSLSNKIWRTDLGTLEAPFETHPLHKYPCLQCSTNRLTYQLALKKFALLSLNLFFNLSFDLLLNQKRGRVQSCLFSGAYAPNAMPEYKLTHFLQFILGRLKFGDRAIAVGFRSIKMDTKALIEKVQLQSSRTQRNMYFSVHFFSFIKA